MSFIHLLFPPGELDGPETTWYEPEVKKRRIEAGATRVERKSLGSLRRQSYGTRGREQRCSKFLEQVAVWKAKRSYSKPSARAIRRPNPAINRCDSLSFVGTPVHANQLVDRASLHMESQCERSSAHDSWDARCSPSPFGYESESLSSPAYSTSTPATPTPICDQFRSGPFGHIFDGLRLTDQERDLVEELVNPSTDPEASKSPSQPHKAPTESEIIDTLSQRIFFDLKYSIFNRIEPSELQITNDLSVPCVDSPSNDRMSKNDEQNGCRHTTEVFEFVTSPQRL